MSKVRVTAFLCNHCLAPMAPPGTERLAQERGCTQVLPYRCPGCASLYAKAKDDERQEIESREKRNRSEWGVLN